MAPFHLEGHGLSQLHTPPPIEPTPGGGTVHKPLSYSKPIPWQPQQDTARPQAEQQTTTYATTPLPQLEPP